MESEAHFQGWVMRAAREFGWSVYHTRFSVLSDGGFPDLVLVKAGEPVIYAELKRQVGVVTPKQQAWLDVLRSALGTRVFVWRPDDRPEILRVLGGFAVEAK